MSTDNVAIVESFDVIKSYTDELANLGFEGDIDLSYSSKIVNATDNSIYHQIPKAILFPKSNHDIKVALTLSNKQQYASLYFGPRGGGTGTNGQSLTSGIVLDLSRHMRNILEFNEKERWVRVQAGVIKDQLNDYLKQYGYFFAPDLSTSNRATVGGMINTDASGQGSLVYGKTSEHILSLKSFLADGYELNTQKHTLEQAKIIANENTREGEVFQQVIERCTLNRDKILSVFPNLNRFLTGYDLKNVFNEDMTEFDLSRVIAGSEGSLAVVAEAKLNILPIEKYKTLININYDNFDSALRHSPLLVSAQSTSVETVDSTILNLAREDIIWESVSEFLETDPTIHSDGLNMVEFNGVDENEINKKVSNLLSQLDQLIENKQAGVVSYSITTDKKDITKIYAMRKKSVGLLGNTKGAKKPVAFVEDTAVPPEHLADYILEFRALLDSHNLSYGMFGHVDAGVLHVRPALDLSDENQVALLKPISDQVAQLTKKYGGLFWGEHGKGYRSEYGPHFFGEQLFLELRKVKTLFDKNNKLNPGKICTPLNSKTQLAKVQSPLRADQDKHITIAVKTEFQNTLNCNGNGLCFNYDTHSEMCPSYKVTKDRRDSPKGRASLFKEWSRLQSIQGVKLPTQSYSDWHISSDSSVMQISELGELKEFNHEVKNAMETCLACKACSNACPVKVDIPNARSYFFFLYHLKYNRQLKDYLIANLESFLPIMSKLARFINPIVNTTFSNWVFSRVLGYQDLPQLSVSRYKTPPFDYQALAQLSQSEKHNTVLLVQDPFTSFYENELVHATVKLVEKLGKQLIILPFHENGKTKHIKGFLPQFKKTAQTTSAFLQKVAKLNIPMIGLDSALVFVYDDEYRKVLTVKERGEFHVLTMHEWLLKQDLSALNITHQANPVTLLAHCTESTNPRSAKLAWKTIFSQLGVTLDAPNVGCCGMAGTFGHERKNQPASKQLYEQSWQEYASKPALIATGFSCRSQVKRYDQTKPKHPVEFIASLLS